MVRYVLLWPLRPELDSQDPFQICGFLCQTRKTPTLAASAARPALMIALLLFLLFLFFSRLQSFKSKSLFVQCYGTFCAFPWHISLFVPCCGTFCAVLWHILCLPVAHFVPSRGTFCAFPWHILCLPVAHKPKSLFVPCYGTFCAFPWQLAHKFKNVFLCRAVAHFVPSRAVAHGILFPLVKNYKSRIASQDLQVKNCKSRIASK
jgi:hypothetical protein